MSVLHESKRVDARSESSLAFFPLFSSLGPSLGVKSPFSTRFVESGEQTTDPVWER